MTIRNYMTMNIDYTAKQISVVHKELQSRAKAAINIFLSIRNWVIGFYIVEYEQNGEDRAEYGKKTLSTMSEKLKELLPKNTENTIRRTVSPEL